MRKAVFACAIPVVLLSTLSFVATGCGDTSIAGVQPDDAARERSEALEIVITVSPATLILDSPGTCVTVHTDIPYSAVDRSSVALSGIAPTLVKFDAHGDLVVKLDRDDVAAIAAPPEATLTLTGLTVDGTAFGGSDTIAVQ